MTFRTFLKHAKENLAASMKKQRHAVPLKPTKDSQERVALSRLLTKKEFQLVLGSFIILLSLFVYVFFTPNKYEGDSPKLFIIQYGESYSSIVNHLYNAHIIKHKVPMRIAGFIYGAVGKVQAGRYRVPNNLSYLDLIEYFISGKGDLAILVNLYDGISFTGVAQRLQGAGIVTKDTLLTYLANDSLARFYGIRANNMLGYLLPGEYVFFQNSNPNEVIQKIHTSFTQFFNDTLLAQAKKSNLSIHQVLTLASIVDGETHKRSEMPTVAGVYLNRLRIGMKLQADPTVQFARNGVWGRVTGKELRINSPYNTYKNAGLPPGPINNPGKSAILAVLYPQHHEYLYFVADMTGGHHFSKSFSEHKSFAKNYHQWLNQKQ